MKKIVILLCSLLCTACMAAEKIIENQGISTIIGYDLLDDYTYKGTISLLQFDRKEEKTSVTLSAEGTTSKQIRQKLEEQTSHDITYGQLRTILFNRNMAESVGIASFLDPMLRDSTISSLIFLGITDNAEKTINNSNYEEYPEMGSYIYQLFDKHEKKEMLVNSNLHDFITTLYEIGIDPTLPIIKNVNGVAPSIAGVALFKDDKIVGSISLINTFYLKLFTNNSAFLGDITVEIPAAELAIRGIEKLTPPKNDIYKITLHPIRYKGNIEITNEKFVNLNATISVSTLEFQPSIYFNSKDSLKRMEQLIGEVLSKEFGYILEELKNLNTDPIGIGRKIRSVRKYSHLTDEELRQNYSKLNIIPNIKVEIMRTGEVF